jgi:hypothetical protein
MTIGDRGVFIPFPIPSNVSLLPPTVQFVQRTEKCSLSLSYIGDLELLSFSIDFLINP